MKFDARATLLVLLLAAALAAPGRAQEAAVPAGDDTSATAAEAKTLNAAEDPNDAESLPEFDQAEIVRGQLARLEKIRQELQLTMVASESDHFIVFSDLDTQVRRAILGWLEDVRTKLSERLGLDAKARLWDGKCLVLVFAKQEFLAKYARVFDNYETQRPRGYFVLESRLAKGPRLVHLAAYQPAVGGNEALQEVLVHETTHAIVELYRKSAHLPLWIHEGLAEYLTTVLNPALRMKKGAEAYRIAGTVPYKPIRDLFTSTFTSTNIAAYSLSMTLIDYLQSVDAGGVMKMVAAIKDGEDAEAALGQAYPGLTYDELEKRWQRYVLRSYHLPEGEAVKR
jgi:hypothetical protein